MQGSHHRARKVPHENGGVTISRGQTIALGQLNPCSRPRCSRTPDRGWWSKLPQFLRVVTFLPPGFASCKLLAFENTPTQSDQPKSFDGLIAETGCKGAWGASSDHMV
ncbi:hypothetical protein VTK26DRAFT_734 [Humicola hyalothermophila]